MHDGKSGPNGTHSARPPRELLGPFLLLGVDKDAGPDQIEARRADRVGAAPPRQSPGAQDFEWASAVLNDPDGRARADADSLNVDTANRVLHGFEEAFGLAGTIPPWPALDAEKPLADYAPAVEVPEPAALREAVTVPPLRRDLPGVAALLEHFAGRPLDPWGAELEALVPGE